MSIISDIFEPLFATIEKVAKTAVDDAEKAITDVKNSSIGEVTIQAADIVEKALATLKADADAFIAKYTKTASSGETQSGDSGVNQN